MAAVATQLNAVFDNFSKNAPEAIKTPINSSRAGLATQDLSKAIKIGDNLPEFSLSNAVGEQVNSNDFKAKGVTLVAITPELPNGTLTMTEKHQLEFPVLTDLHNEYARKLGIVWKQPESLRPVFDQFKHDLPKRNGDDSFEIPLPATLLVDKTGTVRNMFLEADYIKRAEPQAVLEWIDEM